jgi:hypothetical protein
VRRIPRHWCVRVAEFQCNSSTRENWRGYLNTAKGACSQQALFCAMLTCRKSDCYFPSNLVRADDQCSALLWTSFLARTKSCLKDLSHTTPLPGHTGLHNKPRSTQPAYSSRRRHSTSPLSSWWLECTNVLSLSKVTLLSVRPHHNTNDAKVVVMRRGRDHPASTAASPSLWRISSKSRWPPINKLLMLDRVFGG